MDSVALSQEEQAYFETGGAEIPSPVSDAPQPDTADAPAASEFEPSQPVEQSSEPPRDEKGKFVPHQALHAEREEHKKTKAALEEISRRQAIFEDRWNTLLKAREATQEPEQGPPDPETDIFGHAKWQSEQLKRLESQLAERQKQEEQHWQQTQAEQEINSYWNSAVQDYATRTPEYHEAAQWLSEYRHKQLEALSIVDKRMADPAARNQQINAELKAIIGQARQDGQNPAEIVHQLAKNWGFASKPAEQTITLPDKLSSIEKAQQASRTLASTGGKSSDPLTADAIVNMPNEEFARWIADPANERRFAKMMGA